MKSFLAIFTCAENSAAHQAWMKLDPHAQKERLKEGEAALRRWEAKHKAQILFEGGSLSEITKKVDTRGIHESPSQMGAFLVVQAKSHEEAANMFLEHPHFALFPGDGVEILERIDHARGPTSLEKS